ncbi:MAG: hypothetical protein JSW41_03385 [Candidatus Aenigmatarchaeota archaeon]|nr:MAG: hypothetical protein JSW41_03385 [Candidatus Aenigmarchaeota archaeon]
MIDGKPVPTDDCLAMASMQALFTLAYNKGPGDHDGRKRVRGNKEMVYIYYMCDYRSEFENYPDTTRNEESLVAAGLPVDHPTSAELLQAMGEFSHHIRSGNVILGLLETARKSVHKVKDFFDQVNVTIEDTDKIDVIEKKTAIVGKVMDNLGKIPKVIKDLNTIEEEVKKEVNHSSRIQGGAQKGRLG